MKTEEIILNNFQLKYPLERLALLSDILFLDIETTGFLTGSSSIYLIGCAYYEDGNWKLRQWFAQTPDEESEILSAFLAFAEPYSYLIHYNGNTFDLPFSISALADYICSDRSAMMREMKNMRQNGLIDADGRKITLLLD